MGGSGSEELFSKTKLFSSINSHGQPLTTGSHNYVMQKNTTDFESRNYCIFPCKLYIFHIVQQPLFAE